MSNSIIDNQLDYMRPKPIVVTEQERKLFYIRQTKALITKLMSILQN